MAIVDGILLEYEEGYVRFGDVYLGGGADVGIGLYPTSFVGLAWVSLRWVPRKNFSISLSMESVSELYEVVLLSRCEYKLVGS